MPIRKFKLLTFCHFRALTIPRFIFFMHHSFLFESLQITIGLVPVNNLCYGKNSLFVESQAKCSMLIGKIPQNFFHNLKNKRNINKTEVRFGRCKETIPTEIRLHFEIYQ